MQQMLADSAPMASMPAEPRDTMKPAITSTFAVAVLAVVLMGAGAWGMAQGAGGHDHGDVAIIGETVELPDALVRVDAVRPEIMAAMLMPASLMPDMVQDGYRRFAVDMSIVATSEDGVSYDMNLFTISGEGLDPTPVHRAATKPGFVPLGSQATLTMLFDAPLEVEPLFLSIEGTDTQILIDGDLGDGHQHGESPADIVVSGFFQAEIEDFEFLPDSLIIEAGTEVSFHNHDSVVHDVTALDHSWTTDNLSEDQESGSIVFDTPGTYNYFCSIHPTMRGTINVVSSS